MQGVRYKYELTKGYTSDKAAYESCISKDIEDYSIEHIHELHREESIKAIPSPGHNFQYQKYQNLIPKYPKSKYPISISVMT
jgi:hypothetical protein